VPATKELLLKAVEGKAASRLLESERTPMGEVVVRYPMEQDDRKDNLHKQSIRSEVKRLSEVAGGKWMPHIESLGESGFLVRIEEVQPEADAAQTPPAPATMNGQVIDLDVEHLIDKLREAADELAKVAGL
jgi:hypothetical protein